MNVYRVKTGSILPLGKQGENLARKIQFDISRWIGSFGPGTVQLLHQRSGDETPYPVAVEQDGNLAVWTVTSADTAAAGTGRAELQYYVGDALAKSETWMTKVLAALGDAGDTPPEAQQGWVDQVLAQVARITGMTAQAVELPAGSAPTADYADGVLTIGIPLGGDVSEAQIAQAVAEYLSKNPIEETDPTVPAWAKEEKKPSYTAAEVGADPSGTAASQVSAHNTETTAHSDIRLLIQGLTERLNTLADSDDTTLDQFSEIVAYIKSNRTLIEAITTSKVSVADIIDNLTTNVTNKPLSAAQGVALKAMIDAITIPTALPNPNALTFTGAVTGSYDGSAPLEVEIPSGGGGITVTNTAAVGQTVKITGVDENGQPTEWEAVDIPSGGGDGWEKVVDYTHTANLEVAVESIDYSTSTITATGNGLYDGDMIYATLNIGIIFSPLSYLPTGIAYGSRYYVVSATSDTFQIATTKGGTAVTITEKETADFSKWHFERDPDQYYGSIILNNLTLKNNIRVVAQAKTLIDGFSKGGVRGCSPSVPNGSFPLERALSAQYSDGFQQLNESISVLCGSILASSIGEIIKVSGGYIGKLSGVAAHVKANSTYGIDSVVVGKEFGCLTENTTLPTFIKYWNFAPANGSRIEVYTK